MGGRRRIERMREGSANREEKAGTRIETRQEKVSPHMLHGGRETGKGVDPLGEAPHLRARRTG